MEALHKAKKSQLSARWLIKADASDVRKGLRESVRDVWNGDEDFGDGALQDLYHEYQDRSARFKFGSTQTSVDTITEIESQLNDDLTFLVTGEADSKSNYDKALNS